MQLRKTLKTSLQATGAAGAGIFAVAAGGTILSLVALFGSAPFVSDEIEDAIKGFVLSAAKATAVSGGILVATALSYSYLAFQEDKEEISALEVWQQSPNRNRNAENFYQEQVEALIAARTKVESQIPKQCWTCHYFNSEEGTRDYLPCTIHPLLNSECRDFEPKS